MLLWNGACMVHEIFSMEKIAKLKTRHPEAKLIAHPECEEPVLEDGRFYWFHNTAFEVYRIRSFTVVYSGNRNRYYSTR